jgi:hypothetical protein
MANFDLTANAGAGTAWEAILDALGASVTEVNGIGIDTPATGERFDYVKHHMGSVVNPDCNALNCATYDVNDFRMSAFRPTLVAPATAAEIAAQVVDRKRFTVTAIVNLHKMESTPNYFAATGAPTAVQLAELAIYRALSAQFHLVSPNWAQNSSRLHVNECHNATGANVQAALQWYNAEMTIAGVAAVGGAAAIPAALFDPTTAQLVAGLNASRWLSAYLGNVGERLSRLAICFPNVVAMLHHNFWTQGHHFTTTPPSDAKYDSIWAKIDRAGNLNKQATWQQIMTTGLHWIPPLRLLVFTKYLIDSGIADGAIVLRFETYPTGAAIVPVLRRGLDDLEGILPGCGVVFEQHIEGLLDCEAAIAVAGPPTVVAGAAAYVPSWIDLKACPSLGSAMYTACKVRISQFNLNAAAAMIYGVLTTVTPGHPMTKSVALKKFAEASPLMTKVIGNVINDIITHATGDISANLLDSLKRAGGGAGFLNMPAGAQPAGAAGAGAGGAAP